MNLFGKVSFLLPTCLAAAVLAAGHVSAALQHTITSGTDVAVTDSSYVADGVLDLTLGFAPQPGRPITIVRNTGPAFISGTFSGVPQGGTVPLVHNGVTYNYIANYFGENGRSFVLQWPLVQMVAWGDNSDGQLGNGSIGADSIGVPTPVKVVIPPALAGKTVVEVAAGNGFSLALTSQGKVFSWGSSSYGSLGRGMVGDSLFAVEVMFGGMLSGKTVVAIEAGGGHALALTSAGEVISWGYNADGQLGTGSTDYSVAIPVMLDRAHFGSMPVVAISAGTNHSMALTSDGRVFCWGCDSDGQLGSGQRSFTSYPRVPVEVESDDELSGVAFVSIDAGDRHSLALAADGRLFAWGDMSKWVDDGLYSRTSYRPTVVDMNGVLAGKSMSSISAGSSNLVLSQDGEVFSWGRNCYGQLGDGTTTERLVPIAAGSSGLIDGKKVSFIASGLSHGVAVTADGKCHTWGSNNNGQLGNNSNINSSLPVTVSEGDRGAFAGLRTISVSASGSHNLALLDAGPPSIDVTPANRTAAAGATVTFSSSVIPSFDSTVRWQVSNSGPTGTFIDITENPTATTPNLVLPEVSSSQHNQAFRAVFTNISGSTATPPAILKITEWSATLVSASTVPFVSDGPVVSGSLNLTLDFAPEPGTSLTILENTGTAFISGVFENVPHGGRVTLMYGGTSHEFIANYHGGRNGRSLVLQWPWTKLATWGAGTSRPGAVAPGQVLQGKVVLSVASGSSQHLAVTSEGRVAAWGTASDRPAPMLVPANGVLAGKTVVAVSEGYSHGMALCSDGAAVSWGSNFGGALGNGGISSNGQPVAVDMSGALAGKSLVAVSAGEYYALALTSEGRVFSWGYNSSGQLGNGTTASSNVPLPVDATGALAGKVIIGIAAGSFHAMVLTNDGKVYAWGSNSRGQLGNDAQINSLVPQEVGGDLLNKTIVAITAGGEHSLALSSDGSIYAWGYNASGQLGTGDITSRSTPVKLAGLSLGGRKMDMIRAGYSHSVGFTNDGQAFAWGENSAGELGNGTRTDSVVPEPVDNTGVLGGRTVCGIAAGNGASLALYSAESGPEVLISPENRTALLASPPHHVSAIFSAAAVDVFPFSVRWQVSTTGVEGAFADVASNDSAATAELVLPTIIPAQDGWAYRAAFSNSGGTTFSKPAVLRVRTVPDSLSFSSTSDVPLVESNPNPGGGVEISLEFMPSPGTELTLLRNTGGSFISGEFDNLPQGAVLPLSYGGRTHEFIVNYYGGNGRSLVLQWGRTRLTSWGRNLVGEPGSVLPVIRQVPAVVDAGASLDGKTVMKVAAGAYHTLALTSSGRIVAWGANGSGQLGNNSSISSGVPQKVDFSGELAGKTVVAVAAGSGHSLALTSDGRVYSWGSNSSGQLGNGAATGTVSQVPVAVNTSGVLAGKSVVAIAAGESHSLALTSDGGVIAWGRNDYYQLGISLGIQSRLPVAVSSDGAMAGATVVDIAAGSLCSFALAKDGRLYAWGRNGTFQLGQNQYPELLSSPAPLLVGGSNGSTNGKAVVSIVAGASHCLALTSDGKVHSWGIENNGQLGTGVGYSPVPRQLNMTGVLSGKSVARIAAGFNHSLAITSEGQAVAWGSNGYGQVGDNTTNNRSTPVAVTTASGLLGSNTMIAVVGGADQTIALNGVGTAPVVTDPPDHQTIPAGGTVSFTSFADGYPGAPTVRWQSSSGGPGGTFFNISTTATPSAATNTLQLTNVSASRDGYAYRAVFTNPDGVVYSTPAVLTVIPPPQIGVPAAITVDATGKNGAAVNFNVSATDSTDGTLTPACTPPSGSVFPIGTTTVNCTVTNSLGSTSNASFTVTVRRSYASFADLHQLADSAPAADPYHSGINNLLAYAFGMDPAAPDRQQLPTASVVDGHLRISYIRWKDAGDLQYVVEVSEDMKTWNSGPGHTEQLPPTSLDATRETVIGRDLTPVSAAPGRFIRVRVVK